MIRWKVPGKPQSTKSFRVSCDQKNIKISLRVLVGIITGGVIRHILYCDERANISIAISVCRSFC